MHPVFAAPASLPSDGDHDGATGGDPGLKPPGWLTAGCHL